MKKYTDEEMKIAKDFSLSYLAECLGYSLLKRGNHICIKEMDSLMIYDDRTYYRWSRQEMGDTIQFCENYGGKTFDEAVKFILEKANVDREKTPNFFHHSKNENEKNTEKKEFTLPEKCKSSYKRLYAYLIQKRGLSSATINYFVQNDLLYESADRHMLLFAEIFLLILKIYDRLKYKISFNEPKEFVPSIMIGTMLIIML